MKPYRKKSKTDNKQTYKQAYIRIEIRPEHHQKEVMQMKTGFIGAGKVGVSLGKYFVMHGLKVTGYYDSEVTAAKDAAEFTKTKQYEQLLSIVEESDVLFLTVPDGRISQVWEQIKSMLIEGRLICHCSGALSAQGAFSGIKQTGAFGCSIHPMFAVSDKYQSHKELTNAYFTMEGEKESIAKAKMLFAVLKNPLKVIDGSQKTKYHCAAAICSNQVLALIWQSISLLMECGFAEKEARELLAPILRGNVSHAAENGVVKSLTGPVERADEKTVEKHISCLSDKDKLLYVLLSKKLVEIAKVKHEDRTYEALEHLLDKQLQNSLSCKHGKEQ